MAARSTLQLLLEGLHRRLVPSSQLQLAGVAPLVNSNTSLSLDSLWFAVPKSKVTRSKKRMKTTWQNKIPIRKNIVFDGRTGEVTLQHKLPFNWKEYLPKVE